MGKSWNPGILEYFHYKSTYYFRNSQKRQKIQILPKKFQKIQKIEELKNLQKLRISDLYRWPFGDQSSKLDLKHQKHGILERFMENHEIWSKKQASKKPEKVRKDFWEGPKLSLLRHLH